MLGQVFKETFGMGTEVGWFILSEDQQHIGPYTASELRGECLFQAVNNADDSCLCS